MIKSLRLKTVLLVAAAGAAGWGLAPVLMAQTTAPAEDAAPAEAEKPTLTEYSAETVLATVGDSEITLGTLISARQNLPAQIQDLPDTTLFEGLLSQLIDETLLANAGGFSAADESHPDATVQARLLASRRQILAEYYLEETIEPQLDDAALQARYQAMIAEQPEEEEINARHILVKTEEEAKAVIERVNEGGDFAELAKELSTGPSGANGGDLGFFRDGQMVPQFSAAAFGLQPGEVSAPVQTQFGWHVIKVEARRPVQPPAFEQLRDQIRGELARELTQTTLEALRADNPVLEAELLPPASAIREDDLL